MGYNFALTDDTAAQVSTALQQGQLHFWKVNIEPAISERPNQSNYLLVNPNPMADLAQTLWISQDSIIISELSCVLFYIEF